MTTQDESARQAHVKSVFGGELTDTERSALESFLTTGEGREFRDRTDEFVEVESLVGRCRLLTVLLHRIAAGATTLI